MDENNRPAHRSGTFRFGADLTVHRLGFGAMRVTGPGIWGEPRDRGEAIRVLRRPVELGVDFIDTADDQIGTLRDLQAEGKIKHVGLSEVSVAQIAHARSIVPIVSV